SNPKSRSKLSRKPGSHEGARRSKSTFSLLDSWFPASPVWMSVHLAFISGLRFEVFESGAGAPYSKFELVFSPAAPGRRAPDSPNHKAASHARRGLAAGKIVSFS